MSELELAGRRPLLGLKLLHWIGLALIGLAVWLGVGALGTALTPYVNIVEAKAAGRAVQIMGYPQGSGVYQDGAFHFTMKDEMGQDINVIYNQAKPGNFDQAINVVAIGSFDPVQNAFIADSLLVKCPSKYQEERR